METGFERERNGHGEELDFLAEIDELGREVASFGVDSFPIYLHCPPALGQRLAEK